MKLFLKLIMLVAVSAFSFAPTHAQDVPPAPDAGPADQGDQGDQGASFQEFYDQLGDQGTWVQTDDYGYVFQPNVTDPDWAPYTNGHWVYSDAGWVWVSDEPWGWATYHYGRWANIDGTGWVWIPGYRWAPAWVSWRYGGGYCGWAPLPPETFIGAEYGDPGFDAWATFHFGGDVDVSFNIGPGCYNFVPVAAMGFGDYRGHYIDHSRNYTIINNTTNVTNINISKNVVNNGGAGARFHGVSVGGPPINEINAHASQHIPTVRLAATTQPGHATLQGNSLSVFAPHVNPATAKQARPARVAQTLSHPSFNRGDSITKPLQVTSSIQPRQPSATAIQQAEAARAHAPAAAKIATEKTAVRTPVTKPLTSLQTVSPRRTAATTGGNTFKQPGTEHPAAVNAPHTGEPANTEQPRHSPVNSPYTGESATQQPSQAEIRHQQQAKSEQQQQPREQPQERVAPQQREPVEQPQERVIPQQQPEERVQQRAPVQPEERTVPQQHAPVQQQIVRPQAQPQGVQQPAVRKQEPASGGPNGQGYSNH